MMTMFPLWQTDDDNVANITWKDVWGPVDPDCEHQFTLAVNGITAHR
jgi:hypothetical protein